MAGPRQTLTLDAFLAELPDEAAEAAREAAGQIDAIERALAPPSWFERKFVELAGLALILFGVGAAALVGIFPTLRDTVGLLGIMILIGVFPILVGAYLWSVRGRTVGDAEKMRLNDRHFLPHGGLYFGSREGPGKVVRVTLNREPPDLRARTEALHAAATRRRWWW